MKKVKSLKRVLALVMSIVCLVAFNMGSVQVKALQTTVQEKDLISSVTNSSEGKLTITFTIPANTTVRYSCYAVDIIGGRKYTFDEKSSTISNTSSQKVTKSVTVSVNYYGKYEIHATRSNNYIWDTHTITSALKSTKYTNKFVWDDQAIKDYKSGQRVSIIASYVFSTLSDAVATRGAMSALVTVLSAGTVSSGSSTYTVFDLD